jgi:hypothetical protein
VSPDGVRRTPRETRAAHRVLAALEAAYEDADRQVFLRTRDLSESGVYLWAPDPPAVGSEAQLLLELPGQPAFLRLSGTVIRSDPGRTGGFALRFAEGPSAQGFKALRSFVERVLESADEGHDPQT